MNWSLWGNIVALSAGTYTGVKATITLWGHDFWASIFVGLLVVAFALRCIEDAIKAVAKQSD